MEDGEEWRLQLREDGRYTTRRNRARREGGCEGRRQAVKARVYIGWSAGMEVGEEWRLQLREYGRCTIYIRDRTGAGVKL